MFPARLAAAAIVLLTHVAATGVAAWVLVGLWGAASLSSAKAILLAVGLGVYLYLHHRHPQRGWVTGRLVAELTRSVLAVRGLPGRLDYLNDFHLPSCRRLLCSFSILHLQSAQRQAMAREAFIAHYLKPVENREGTKGGRIPVQLHYFRKRVQTAKLWRKILGLVFMVSSGLALLTAVLYIGLHWYHVLPEEMSNWQRLIFKLLPVALPMIAAGAASWASMLDLDRRIERYEGLVDFLHYQAEQIRHSASNGILNRLVSQTEHALLQEVVEWHAKHAHVQGH